MPQRAQITAENEDRFVETEALLRSRFLDFTSCGTR